MRLAYCYIALAIVPVVAMLWLEHRPVPLALATGAALGLDLAAFVAIVAGLYNEWLETVPLRRQLEAKCQVDEWRRIGSWWREDWLRRRKAAHEELKNKFGLGASGAGALKAETDP